VQQQDTCHIIRDFKELEGLFGVGFSLFRENPSGVPKRWAVREGPVLV